MPNKTDFFDYEPIRPNRSRTREENLDPTSWISPQSDNGQQKAEGHQESLSPSSADLDYGAPVAQTRLARLLKKGHTLTFLGLFLFTIVLYFRPYELFESLSAFNTLAFWLAIATLVIFLPTQFGLEGNLSWRPREVNLVLLLTLAGLMSIPTAINPGEAWDQFIDVFIKAVLMFIVMVNVVRTERRLKSMLILALAVSYFLAIHAIIDYRSGAFSVEGYRISGVIGNLFANPNDLAMHLVTIAPIAVALLFTTRNPLMKLVYSVGAVLIVIAIVVTYSRGGFIGLCFIGTSLALKFGRRKPVIVVVLAVAFLVLFLGLAPGNYIMRLASIFDSGLDPNGSSSARSELFKRSVFVAIAHPIFGIGMGNFHIVSIREAVSHNSYTQVASEMGFAASVIYTMFIVAPLRRLRAIERKMVLAGDLSRFYYLSIGLQVSLIGYMVCSFFASVAYLFNVYYLVGYAVCARRLYEAELNKVPKSSAARNSI